MHVLYFQKLWSLCDLTLSLLIQKTTSYELKEFPTVINMPAMYYSKPNDSNFTNNINYLPLELMPKNPKKASASGIIGQYLQQKCINTAKSDNKVYIIVIFTHIGWVELKLNSPISCLSLLNVFSILQITSCTKIF